MACSGCKAGFLAPQNWIQVVNYSYALTSTRNQGHTDGYCDEDPVIGGCKELGPGYQFAVNILSIDPTYIPQARLIWYVYPRTTDCGGNVAYGTSSAPGPVYLDASGSASYTLVCESFNCGEGKDISWTLDEVDPVTKAYIKQIAYGHQYTNITPCCDT